MNPQPNKDNPEPAGVGIGWRPKFAETSQPTLHQFIHDHPLGELITYLSHHDNAFPQLQKTHIPFMFYAPEPSAANDGNYRPSARCAITPRARTPMQSL